MAQGIIRLLRRLAITRRQFDCTLARYASTGTNEKTENVDKAKDETPSSQSAHAKSDTKSEPSLESSNKTAEPSSSSISAASGYEEVAYAPRRAQMPLPEDRPEMVEVEIPGDENSPPRKVFRKLFRPATSVDYNLPLPRIVPQEKKKPMEPMSLIDAIRIVKGSARAMFDETVEAHIRLSIDPKRSDQSVRGAVTLPHGSGKAVRIAVFADGAAAEEALAAGADIVGSDDLVASILASGGKLEFEKCIATPSLMPKLGKIARILGPRGLMPNPKVGTVTGNVGEAVKAAKQGRVDFRVDKMGIIHAGLGKVSFTDEALLANIGAFAGAVLAAKPAGLKKTSKFIGFFHKVHITSTMGKAVPVSIQSLAAASESFMKAHEA